MVTRTEYQFVGHIKGSLCSMKPILAVMPAIEGWRAIIPIIVDASDPSNVMVKINGERFGRTNYVVECVDVHAFGLIALGDGMPAPFGGGGAQFVPLRDGSEFYYFDLLPLGVDPQAHIDEYEQYYERRLGKEQAPGNERGSREHASKR